MDEWIAIAVRLGLAGLAGVVLGANRWLHHKSAGVKTHALVSIGAAVAMLMAWGLAFYVFEFRWHASPWVLLMGVLVGAGLAWAAGWWGLRDVLRRPVVQTLREART